MSLGAGFSRNQVFSSHITIGGVKGGYIRLTVLESEALRKLKPYIYIGLEKRLHFMKSKFSVNAKLIYIHEKMPYHNFYFKSDGQEYYANMNFSRSITLAFGINYYFKKRTWFVKKYNNN
jgi:hypothetical protein